MKNIVGGFKKPCGLVLLLTRTKPVESSQALGALAFDGMCTVFANVPNSTLFGVHCPLKGGRKKNEWMDACVRETATGKQTSIALIGNSRIAWQGWRLIPAHQSRMEKYQCPQCVSALARQCFHYKCPRRSIWTKPGRAGVRLGAFKDFPDKALWSCGLFVTLFL